MPFTPPLQLINGFICHDCTEIDLAKKNIDPADPKGEKAKAKAEASGAHGSKKALELAAARADKAVEEARENRPVEGATRGGKVSLYV